MGRDSGGGVLGRPCARWHAHRFPARRRRHGGETVVFPWIEWPDKATRDAAAAKMQTDPRMAAQPMPFDGKRMIFGGFAPVVVLEP